MAKGNARHNFFLHHTPQYHHSLGDTPAVERGFLRTLALIKAGSEKLRDKAAQLYVEAAADADEEEPADDSKLDAAKAAAKTAKDAAKPVRLADHMLNRYEKYGEEAFEEEEAVDDPFEDSGRRRIKATAPDERKALAEFKKAAASATSKTDSAGKYCLGKMMFKSTRFPSAQLHRLTVE